MDSTDHLSRNKPHVAIVVPVYNRIATTQSFLRDVEAVSYENYEIIVVDDGSTDHSSEIIAREFPHVHLLQTPGDYWWSKSMNLGVRDALRRGAEYILTINDDVSFEPDFLSRLVDYATIHPRTLVGSYIYDFDDRGTLWYAGGKISYLQGEFFHRVSMSDGALRWLTAMGVLIPAEAFDAAGFYDEIRFPQYMADADFSMRAHKVGFALAIEPRSIIYNRTALSNDEAIRRSASLRDFLTPLFTRKSVAYWPSRWWVYRLYWPSFLWPVGLLMYYGRFFAKRALRLLKLR